jgi:hypothetical protein
VWCGGECYDNPSGPTEYGRLLHKLATACLSSRTLLDGDSCGIKTHHKIKTSVEEWRVLILVLTTDIFIFRCSSREVSEQYHETVLSEV